MKLINLVVIGSDKSIVNDYSREIENLCIANNINYQYRTNFKNTNSNVLIAIGWRWIIKKEDGQKLIIFHDSLLPKYRGFNPLVTALINGDKYIGVTALFGAEEFDKGDIITSKKIKIQYPIKIENAIALISECYANLLNQIIIYLKKDNLPAKIQDESKASYSLWRDDEDYFINWSWDARKIKRHVDAVGFPYLGARTTINSSEFIVLETTVLPDVKIENRTPGKLIWKDNGKPVVACGKGLLRIDSMKNRDSNQPDFSDKFRIRFK